MIVSLRHFLGWLVSVFRSREDLVLENLALRRQLLAVHAQQPRRRLTTLHKLFWVALRTFWSAWTKPLRDTPFRDIETQLQQFAVHPRCSPGRILSNHAEDQGANFFADRLPSSYSSES